MHRYPLLTYISIFSVVIPIGAGILKISSMDRGMKVLFFYLLFAFTADIYLMWFSRSYQITLAINTCVTV